MSFPGYALDAQSCSERGHRCASGRGACVRAWGTWGPASCAVQRWHCARCLAPAPHSRPGAPRPGPVPAAAAPLASPASSACAGLSGRHPPGGRSLWLLAATPVWLLRAHGIRTAHPHHPASPYFRVRSLNFICRSPFALPRWPTTGVGKGGRRRGHWGLRAGALTARPAACVRAAGLPRGPGQVGGRVPPEKGQPSEAPLPWPAGLF